MAKLTKQDRYRMRQLRSGLCTNCGRKNTTSRFGSCKECRLKKAAYEQRKRDNAKAEKEKV